MKTFSNIIKYTNYAYELVLLNKPRMFKDGLTVFNLILNWDRYLGDHSPQVEFGITIFNYEVCMFKIYYRWHRGKQHANVLTLQQQEQLWNGD